MLLLVFTACKKDDDKNPSDNKGNTASTISAFDYLPTTKGSYWIFETYKVDKNGIETTNGEIDSCYITGDTMINGVKYIGYYNFSPHEPNKTTYLANFNGELKNNFGMVYYDTKDFSRVLGKSYYTLSIDTLFLATRTAREFNNVISVPAGNFSNSIQHNLTIDVHPKFQEPNKPNSVTEETHYEKKVGPVKQQYYFFSNRDVVNEWRLIRYHIAP